MKSSALGNDARPALLFSDLHDVTVVCLFCGDRIEGRYMCKQLPAEAPVSRPVGLPSRSNERSGRVRTPKWIKFDVAFLPDAKRKTTIWIVRSLGNVDLGSIHWHGAWRKYCFFPKPETVFEQDCLRDIADFCQEQSKLHREAKKGTAA